MQDLELTWESYEFHSSQIIELENNLILKVSEAQLFLQNNSEKEFDEASYRFEKVNILNAIIDFSNKLILSYQKQCNLLSEIMEIQKDFSSRGLEIPPEREVSVGLLEKLKLETFNLIEGMKEQKEELRNILS